MRALVLQGGGAKGAFQVGVLKHLMGELEIDYDIVCGVSVGAINGAWVAQTPRGEEKAGAAELARFWTSIDNDDIRKKWFAWPLTVPWKPSVYNSRPLQDLLRRELDQKKMAATGRKFRAGAVSLTSGMYKTWRETDEDIVEGVLASSSFPGGLIPIRDDGHWWTDGGVRDQTPLNEAIKLGATTCDIILLSSLRMKREGPEEPNTLDVLIRSLDIALNEIAKNDLEKAKLYNELVEAGQCTDKRPITLNVLSPSKALGSTLDFDPTQIRANIELGLEQAREEAWV